jgi:hypothetical protein
MELGPDSTELVDIDCGHFMSIFRPDEIVRMIDEASSRDSKRS